MVSFTKNGSGVQRFSLGRLLMTPGARDYLTARGVNVMTLLQRHANNDWGDVCREDASANEEAIRDGSRILSAYQISYERIYVITEAEDDNGKRIATTVLLASEY